MKIKRGPSLERGQDSGVWNKIREFIVSCSRINQSSLQSVSIWTKTRHSSWIDLVQQVCDLADIALFWRYISPTVCSLLPSLICDLWSQVGCAATLKYNEGIRSQLCNLPLFCFYHFRVELIFTIRRGKRWHMRTSSGIWIQQYFYFIHFFIHYQKHYLNRILWDFDLLP